MNCDRNRDSPCSVVVQDRTDQLGGRCRKSGSPSEKLTSSAEGSSSSSSEVTKERSRQRHNQTTSCSHSIARIFILDFPVCLLFSVFALTRWYGHVQHNYLVPQYKALKFHRQRYLLDNTYYTRVCDDSDMSTKTSEPLWISPGEDVYAHQLRHGFTILPQVIPNDQAEALREHILTRNAELTPEESIYVIQGDNRYSFGLDPSIPVVAKALESLNLRSHLKSIIGPDAAIIELTAITSTYGAVAQWWHDDVVSNGSPVQYARSFGPSYSIFIPLQDTTIAMGATAVCPGTHVCSGGKMHAVCNTHGFPVANNNTVWKQGDAMLMNMNSWHRGTAHTDPTPGHERVVLILTVVPVPQSRAETRQLAQGITFSLRPELWGHTLADLEQASTRMVQPWTTLRALGLAIPKGATWGIDGITSASIRAANSDNGFREKNLVELYERGGLSFLPGWMQAGSDEIDWEAGDVWYQFASITYSKCAMVAAIATLVGTLLYLVLSVVTVSSTRTSAAIRKTFYRLSFIGIFVGLVYWKAQSHVDSTGWAKDIRAGRRYASTADFERQHFFSLEEQDQLYFSGPSALPNKYDVLIESRYGSRQLALYNDFVNQGHPGNRALLSIVNELTPFYRSYGANLQRALLQQRVVQSVVAQQGRFLGQGPDGFWMWLASTPVAWLHEQLSISNSLMHTMLREARFVESEYKYGKLRTTKVMAWKHAIPYVNSLRRKMAPSLLSDVKSLFPGTNSSSKTNSSNQTLRRFTNLQAPTRLYTLLLRSPPPRNSAADYKEPYPGAWLYAGEEVEFYDEDDGYWYHGGSIFFITAQGQFILQFTDGTQQTMDRYDVRRWRPYQPNDDDPLECHFNDGEYRTCRVQTVEQEQQSYIVSFDHDPEALHRIGKMHLRREGPPIPPEVDVGEETEL